MFLLEEIQKVFGLKYVEIVICTLIVCLYDDQLFVHNILELKLLRQRRYCTGCECFMEWSIIVKSS